MTYESSILEALNNLWGQSRGGLLMDIALRRLIVEGYLIRHVYLWLSTSS